MASNVFQNAAPWRERDAALDGDEVEDDALRDEPAVSRLGAIERRDDEDRRAARGLGELVDQVAEGALVVVAIEPLQVALVGAVLEDDERGVAQRELLLPVRAVLTLPVDGHRGVRAERVVDDAGLVALERHAEETHGAAAHGAHREARLAVGRRRTAWTRDTFAAPRVEKRSGGAPRTRELDVAAARAARGNRRRSARRCARSRRASRCRTTRCPPP